MHTSPESTRLRSTGPQPVRGTQSFVHLLGALWRRPALLARELAWRWLYGIPALLLLFYAGRHLLALLLAANTGIANFSLQDPMVAAQVVASSAVAITPDLLRVAVWMGPLLAAGWAIASGLGRSFVIRALEPRTRFVPGRVIALQLLRVVLIAGTFLGWFAAVRWAAHTTLNREQPNLVAYSAYVICFSLGIFTAWLLLSWVLSIAPLLATLEGRGVLSSLLASLRLGPLTGKLVEINLVLGIVKLALLVLAMVFSATPLPFESIMSGTPLYLWWGGVTLLYLIASDFFQVARVAAFIQFWRVFRGPEHRT